MHLNEELVESVEDGADGQAAIHLTNGNRVIVAHDAQTVVSLIRGEKVNQLRKVFAIDAQGQASDTRHILADVRRLEKVKDQ